MKEYKCCRVLLLNRSDDRTLRWVKVKTCIVCLCTNNSQETPNSKEQSTEKSLLHLLLCLRASIWIGDEQSTATSENSFYLTGPTIIITDLKKQVKVIGFSPVATSIVKQHCSTISEHFNHIQMHCPSFKLGTVILRNSTARLKNTGITHNIAEALELLLLPFKYSIAETAHRKMH